MKQGKRLTKEQISDIIRLRKEGYRIKYISEKLSVNKNTVVKYSKGIRNNA